MENYSTFKEVKSCEFMKFRYKTKDGIIHTKEIQNDEEHRLERLEFIDWLEFSKDVIWWI